MRSQVLAMAKLMTLRHANQMAILANVPPGDPRHETYMKSPENQFGRWRFERVLIDFKPDVVIDVHDYWMNLSTAHHSDLIFWVLMPTVDSAPQQEGWLILPIATQSQRTTILVGT